MKFFPVQSGPTSDNSGLVESLVYKVIVTHLIKNNTPYVINFIAFSKCQGFIDNLHRRIAFLKLSKSEDDQETAERLEILSDSLHSIGEQEGITVDNSVTYILMTEKAKVVLKTEPPVFFESWLKGKHTLREYQEVLFQVVWTLACFQKIGLRHNDLHPKNIFVERGSSKNYNTFKYEKKPGESIYFKVPAFNNLKFYDYDRASVTGSSLKENAILTNTSLQRMVNETSICSVGYGCNVYNPGFDLYVIFCGIHYFQKDNGDPKLIAFLKKWLKQMVNDYDQHQDNDKCQPGDKEVLVNVLPQTILEDDFFTDLQTTPNVGNASNKIWTLPEPQEVVEIHNDLNTAREMFTTK
jgi:hypothetical protein